MSLLIAGCSTQNKAIGPDELGPNPLESETEFLNGNKFQLTPVNSLAKIKSTEVLSFLCETIVSKPTEASPNCADFGITIRDIKWKIWSANGSSGAGVYRVNDCKPDCATGKIFEVPVRVELDDLYTDGIRYFLRQLTFIGKDKLPFSDESTGTWDLAQFYIESLDMRINS